MRGKAGTNWQAVRCSLQNKVIEVFELLNTQLLIQLLILLHPAAQL
ncbi:MAG: hypothetical protein ACI9G1_004680 [Pirellulaceae bacterium]|jgi:hypothetical protein